MNTAQKTLIALATLAAAATGLAAPAMAGDVRAVVRVDYDRHGGWDDHGRHGGWDDRDDNRGAYQLDERIDRLQDRIRMGERTGQLNRREAFRLRDRLDRIEATKRAYERSGRGLDRREVAMLSDSLDRLADDIHDQRSDRDYGRGGGNRW